MKKLNLWLFASLFVAAFALSACSSSDSSDGGGTPAPQPLIQPGTPVNPANMNLSALSGFVKDSHGYALQGVTVTSGTETTKTDRNGGFVLNKVNTKNGRTIVKFEMDGYNDIVRAAEKQDGDIWEVVMTENWSSDVATNTYSSSQAIMSSVNSMIVDLKGDGYKKADDGAAFSGTVSQKVQYLDPDDEDFAEKMPGGDLAAVRSGENGGTAGEEVQLISYGMTKVDLTDASTGEKLQLADGKPAKLTFPVPDKFKDDKPSTIPLWSFNETTGLWEEEGVATYDATNDVYVGEVKHFSWVNLDVPEVRVRLTVVVKDEKGNLLPGVKVDIDAQKNVITNKKGQVSTFVPKNTEFYVTVHSEDYANYDGSVKQTVSPMDKDGTITIVLPTVAHISGKVVNQGEGNNVATVWIEYDGKETKKMHTDVDGQFFIIAPADYKGKAKLKVRSADGKVKSAEIELDGTDQAFTINIQSDINAGGTGKFVLNGKTYNFSFGEVSVDNEGGAVIIGNTFAATSGYPEREEGMDGFVRSEIQVSNYSAGKTSYTLGDMDHVSMWSEGEGGFMEVMFQAGSSVTITPTAKTYRIQVSGKAVANGGDFGWNGQEGQEANQGDATLDITVPLYARGSVLSNVTAANNPLPSWAPVLEGPADFGVSITESDVLGKGGALMYFEDTLSIEDYNALKATAEKNLGKAVSEYDYYNSSNATFFKDGKWLVLGFNNYYNKSNRPENFIDRKLEIYSLTSVFGRITIVAYDGYTQYVDNDQRKIRRRYAPKRLNK